MGAVEIGIYRPDYDFPDDARTDCSQFRRRCRHPAGRLFGSAGGDIWLYFASCILVTVLSYLYLKYRKMSMLQSVLETLRPAVVSMIAAAGVSILITAFWNDAVSFMSTKWDSIVIFVVAVWLLKKKTGSDSCDGAERFRKAGSAGCACAGWHSMIR